MAPCARSTSRSWAPGWPGWPRRERSWPPGVRSRCSRPATGSAGRTLNEPLGRRPDDRRARRPVGRPTQHRLLALIGELGLATFPTLHRRASTCSRGRQTAPLPGHDPAVNPLALADVGQAHGAAEPDGAQRARSRRRGQRRAPAAGTRRRSLRWMRRNVAHARRPSAAAARARGRSGHRAGRPSLLHVLFYIRSAGSLEALLDTEGGAQQDRFVGGSQLLSLRMAERLGEPVVLGRPCGRSPRTTAAPSARRPRAARCAPGTRSSRSRPADGRHRLDAGAAPRPRRPHPAHGHGQRRQVHGHLRRSRSGAPTGLTGQATDADGPIKVMFDNSPPGGPPGCAARLPRGSRRAGRDAGSARRAPRPGHPAAWRASSARGRRARRALRRPGLGGRMSGAAAATARTCRRAAGAASGRRCGHRSAACTGRAPRRRRSGTATWTARSTSGERAAAEVLRDGVAGIPQPQAV